MTTTEFSNQFDVLYNNITSNQAPGLNEYEKSVFLTKAQDELVKNYFTSEGNPHQKGFDDNQKRQIDFSMLMDTAEGTDLLYTRGTVDPRAISYALPPDIMYIINESVLFYKDEGNVVLGVRQVIPLSYGEYTRLMSKPFKEPVKNQAWRLITSKGDRANADIIITSSDKSKYLTGNEGEGMKYIIRYVRRPLPIILVNLKDTFGEGLSIHNKDTQTECELDPSIHEEILQRAVELAKVAWQGDVQTVTQAGQRSE